MKHRVLTIIGTILYRIVGCQHGVRLCSDQRGWRLGHD